MIFRKKKKVNRRINRLIRNVALPIAYRKSLARIAGSAKTLVIETINNH